MRELGELRCRPTVLCCRPTLGTLCCRPTLPAETRRLEDEEEEEGRWGSWRVLDSNINNSSDPVQLSVMMRARNGGCVYL